MSNYFALPGGLVVADVQAEENSVSGTGRPELPILLIPVRMQLRGPRTAGESIDFRELRCRVSPFDASYVAESRAAPIKVRMSPEHQLPDHFLHLEIPLDHRRLALIERMRKGSDVKLRLDCELLVDELFEIQRVQGSFAPVQVWGLKDHHRLQNQVHISIPRSVWVERVLPGTEFGKVHIIELPRIPIESCSGLKDAFNALQQAQKMESQGLYDDAVGKCRVALEPFFEVVEKVDPNTGEKKRFPILKSSWETKLGRATYDWLDASFRALKDPTNKPHHSPKSYFDQLDAQMLLAVTTSLIAYAVQTESEKVS